MRESRIEQELVRLVQSLGGEVRKLNWIGRRGAPDRAVFLPRGVFVMVELKAPGKKPEPHQVREHARLAKMGFPVLVLDTIEAVQECFAYARVPFRDAVEANDWLEKHYGNKVKQ